MPPQQHSMRVVDTLVVASGSPFRSAVWAGLCDTGLTSLLLSSEADVRHRGSVLSDMPQFALPERGSSARLGHSAASISSISCGGGGGGGGSGHPFVFMLYSFFIRPELERAPPWPHGSRADAANVLRGCQILAVRPSEDGAGWSCVYHHAGVVGDVDRAPSSESVPQHGTIQARFLVLSDPGSPEPYIPSIPVRPLEAPILSAAPRFPL